MYPVRGTAANPSTLLAGDAAGAVEWCNMTAANVVGDIVTTFTGGTNTGTMQLTAFGSSGDWFVGPEVFSEQ